MTGSHEVGGSIPPGSIRLRTCGASAERVLLEAKANVPTKL